MVGWSRLFGAFAVALIVSVSAQADLMSVSDTDVEVQQAVQVRSEVVVEQHNSQTDLGEYNNTTDFDLNPIPLSCQATGGFSELSLTQDAQILTNGQNSFNLCLSALIGLGLCSSIHCLRKVNFGFIPEWYHNGGPYQIGHSFAVNPDSVCPVPVCCFIQPDNETEDHISITRTRGIVSLWRKSQYTPDVIASRGPPCIC